MTLCHTVLYHDIQYCLQRQVYVYVGPNTNIKLLVIIITVCMCIHIYIYTRISQPSFAPSQARPGTSRPSVPTAATYYH